MKVLLIGANGQLGTDFQEALQRRGAVLVSATHAQLDICDSEAVSRWLDSVRPDVVVNTAAFHKVELCEENPGQAFRVNALAIQGLARACHRFRCTLVHFSTDYVFDGGKRAPYDESDLPRPLNAYGVSKLAGEYLLSYSTEAYLLVRTSGLYGLAGSSGKGGNFVENMIKQASQGAALRVVDDQVLTPTYTADLADKITELIAMRAVGMFHVSSEGECSWYEFARKMFQILRQEVDLVPVKTGEFPSPVTRPSYSVLRKERLRQLGVGRMANWEDALGRYLQARARRAT